MRKPLLKSPSLVRKGRLHEEPRGRYEFGALEREKRIGFENLDHEQKILQRGNSQDSSRAENPRIGKRKIHLVEKNILEIQKRLKTGSQPTESSSSKPVLGILANK